MCGNCGSVVIKAGSPYEGYPIGCCSVREGYYCIWTLDHATMECEEWAELCDLRSVLHTVSHITFNVVAERARARTALMNLKRDAPFGECKRFPWRKTYVNISCSVYSSLLQDLLSALDFKDRETEKEMRYGSGHKQDDKDQHNSASSSMDDAKTRFRNTMVKFQNALCKKDEVYDRIKFEKKYQLDWCVGECPKEPNGSPNNPNEPPKPENRIYGDMMKVMRNRGLSPPDFSVFLAADMRKNNFECNREIQALGSSLEREKFPSAAKKIFVFARAEYAECGDDDSEVQGYIYDKELDRLDGPVDLKKYKLKKFKGKAVNRPSWVEDDTHKFSAKQWEKLFALLQKVTSDDEDVEEKREDFREESSGRREVRNSSSSSFEKVEN